VNQKPKGSLFNNTQKESSSKHIEILENNQELQVPQPKKIPRKSYYYSTGMIQPKVAEFQKIEYGYN